MLKIGILERKEVQDTSLDRYIPAKNLGRMVGEGKNGMKYQLYNESMGGNAGTFEENPCGAVNFSYDNQTGELLVFANGLTENDLTHRGTFRIALDLKHKRELIVEYWLNPFSSEKAALNIEKSVELYNLSELRKSRSRRSA